MQAQELLDVLEARGARVHVLEGGRLGVTPAGLLTDELRAEVRANRDALVEALRPRPSGEDLYEIANAPLIASREQIGAVLLRTRRFGEVWVVLEESTFEGLRAEEQARGCPRPVVRVEQLLRSRGRSEETIRAVLETLAIFPDVELLA